MGSFAIHADRFILPATVQRGGYLVICDGLIAGHEAARPDLPVIDLDDSWVAPGLVDTHIHGFLGHDVMDGDPVGLRAISRGLLDHGVTSWVPTTLTASVDRLEAVCAAVASVPLDHGGARMQGIFLEGPFLAERYKGVQNPGYFCDPSRHVLRHWQAAAKGLIAKVAVAAERGDAPEFCWQAVDDGVTVALGHSDATYEEAASCLNAGATVFVHTFDGMSPFHHRHPAMVGAAFVANGTYAEVVCDGHHLHPMAVKALVDAKGWSHVALVTDCMRAGGMPDGDYTLGVWPVHAEGGAVRSADGDQDLAGSVLTLDRAVRNVVDWGLARPEEAIRMATEVAADSCGLGVLCGRLLPGRPADLAVFAPDLTLRRTYLGGECVYAKR